MRPVVSTVVSGSVGFLVCWGLFHLTGSLLVELGVGFPLILVNAVLVGRGVVPRPTPYRPLFSYCGYQRRKTDA